MNVQAAHYKRYLLELGGALLAYAAVLVGSILWLQSPAAPAGLARDALALSPMFPALLGVWAILRQLRRMDELQRQVQLEALGFAFAATAFISFGYGFLEGVGYPKLTAFTIWPLMAILWVIGGQIAARRFR